MNDAFKADYYRMTGKKFSWIGGWLDIFLRHNIRYMYWWRLRNVSSKNLFAKISCYKLSKKYGLEIGNCQIGKGLYVGHAFDITINSKVRIGKNVNIHKGVTIGNENRGKRMGAPIIGDKVYIGVNATVIDCINIGNDVMIAPNSFVNFDVPDHSVVIGNPATIHHKENATEGYIAFCVEV